MKKYLQNFWSRRYLLLLLIQNQLKIKYRGSILGVLWSLLNPLFISIILYFVFGSMFNRDETFIIYLLIGRIMYTFFASGTKVSMNAVLASSNLTKKVYIPKYYFPLSRTIVILIESTIALIIVFLVMPIADVPYHINNVFILLPIILMFFFTYGIGLVLASINVFFRDMEHIFGIILVAWMYLTPIFYPMDFLRGRIEFIVKLNPLYYLIKIGRDAILNGAYPSWNIILITFSFALVAMIIGNYFFFKTQDKFVLYL